VKQTAERETKRAVRECVPAPAKERGRGSVRVYRIAENEITIAKRAAKRVARRATKRAAKRAKRIEEPRRAM